MASTNDLQANARQEDAAPDIFAPAFGKTGLSLLEKVKIQAQVLVPVLRAFRAELGGGASEPDCQPGTPGVVGKALPGHWGSAPRQSSAEMGHH